MNKTPKIKIGYLISHPIQYQVPLYKYIYKKNLFDFNVFYLSDFSLKKHLDQEFKESFNWGINLTEGYKYTVLKSFFLNKVSFLSPLKINFYKLLKDKDLKFVIVHGWGSLSNILFIIQAKFLNKKILLRGEASDHFNKNRYIKKFLRENFLKILFYFVDGFLFIGKNNKQFYLNRNIPEKKLFFAPYCVDNHHFNMLKHKNDHKIKLLFVGKFINRKRTIDLLKALALINTNNAVFRENVLINIIGSGENEKKLKDFGNINSLNNVKFLGFKNQNEIREFYSLSDILVITSENEPWGLVVNEAMASSCAIISSDGVGCANDLVKNDFNGFIYPTGDVKKLSEKIVYLTSNLNIIEKFKKNSLNLISEYSFQNVLNGINEAKNKLV